MEKLVINNKLKDTFSKTNFQSELLDIKSNYYIEISIITPKEYEWIYDVKISHENKDTSLNEIAEKILDVWSKFDPEDEVKNRIDEVGYDNISREELSELVQDVKWLDDKLEKLTDNMQKFFGNNSKALRFNRKRKEVSL